MKKIISLALAILMIAMAVSMVACKKDDEGDSTPADTNSGIPSASTPAADESTPADGTSDVVFTDCDEKVYVVDVAAVNLRSAPNYEDTAKAVSVNFATELRRIGKSDEWSKVVYNDVEYFVVTKYLSTTNPGITFEDRDEVVYATDAESQYIQLRSFPSRSDAAKAMSLEVGTQLKRTGVMFEAVSDDNPDGTLGWSRVEYNGEIYYARNSVLTTEAPAAAQ